MANSKQHRFGGDWTSRKLEILAAYLAEYRKALKKQPFTLAYIDAFAGTGYRTPHTADDPTSLPLFPDLAAPESQALLDGSARLALQVQPPFDKAIDMWLLFPLGIGVNRMLTKKPQDIPESWRRRLTALLGTDEWEQEFYRTESEKMPFGDEERVVKTSLDVIAGYFVARLETIFPGVAEDPAVLENSKGSPLYLFCFAAANKKGATVALRIANYLLRVVQ